ncbi:MAG: molybdenum cofactor guanylyltransferase [Polyangiales bacterium]
MQRPNAAPLLGVLAGGQGKRMGGRDKARLRAPGGDEMLVERLLRLGREVGLGCVLVGGEGIPGVPLVRDSPTGIGPIGGLCALLTHAGQCSALALACDLPYVSAALLSRLACTQSTAAVLAPRDPVTGKWQPLFARYDSPRVLPLLLPAIDAGVRSFQTFLRGVEVQELELSPAERAELRDWDEPKDVQ